MHKWRLLVIVITLAAFGLLSGLLYHFLQPSANVIHTVTIPMPDLS